ALRGLFLKASVPQILPIPQMAAEQNETGHVSRRGRFLIVSDLLLLDLNGDEMRGSASVNEKQRASTGFAHRLLEFSDVVHRLMVHLLDDVALLQARFRLRA